MKEREQRQLLTVSLTKEQYEFIRERADQEHLSIADYIRYAVMFESCMGGNYQAWSIFAKGFPVKLMEWLNERLKKLKVKTT